jgi:hypothetical protein
MTPVIIPPNYPLICFSDYAHEPGPVGRSRRARRPRNGELAKSKIYSTKFALGETASRCFSC